MLKNIPSILSPALMDALMSMGHGDEIVLADGNFPAASHARKLVRADGLDACALLEAIVKFFPLDSYDPEHAVVMQVVESHAPEPPIWQEFRRILAGGEGRPVRLTPIERFAFYERAKSADAIVATGEKALYANLLLKKGVVTEG